MRQQFFYNLHTRLTAVVVATIMLPIIGLLLVVTMQAERGMEGGARDRLESVGLFLTQRLADHLAMNERALSEIAILPGITSMNREQQKPILEAMVATYPHLLLVSTTDNHGFNVARSDTASLTDYSDWEWFQAAASGFRITYQTVDNWGNSNAPALIVSTPIRDQLGVIQGVVMLASSLEPFNELIQTNQYDNMGFAYLVNEEGLALAHPHIEGTSLSNLLSKEPVSMLLAGQVPPYEFTDSDGVEWLAYSTLMDNGWIVVTQQKMEEVTMQLRMLQRATFTGALLVLATILVFVWTFTRLTLRPIHSMTQAAFAIADGDFNQSIPIRRRDELGVLASAFNLMAGQIRDLIGSLEERVTERTQRLFQQAQELDISNQLNQRRATQLEASAEVANAAASILEPDRMLSEVTRLIADRFGHYHAGIFLLDDTKTWAVLHAANSAGGQRMLARNHQLAVAEQSVVGFTTSTGNTRLARDVGADAIHFDNPDLPETRSEIALPLIARNQILGALDVQSKHADAFDAQEIAIFQALADQIAMALDNARLFEATQEALRQVEAVQRQTVSRAWNEHLAASGRTGLYVYQKGKGQPVEQPREAEEVFSKGSTVVTLGKNGDDPAIVVPIKVRDQVIGALGLKEEGEDHRWSPEQIELVETVADQVAQALEAARLFEDTQRRAQRESLISEISAKIRAADDIDEILRVTIQETRRALGVTHGAIRLGTESHLLPPTNHKEEENA